MNKVGNLRDYRDRQARNGSPAALLLTALPIEAAAVLAHLSGVVTVVGDKGTIYQCGRFLCPAGDWFVIVAITTAGNHGAGSVLQTALQDFLDVDLVLFVGVAGSLKDDVVVGSVVAGQQVYDIHSGKAEEDKEDSGSGFSSRPRSVMTQHRIVQAALQVVLHADWPLRIKPPVGRVHPDPYPCVLPPAAYVAPIASGEQVVASINNVTYTFIKRFCNDAFVLEMEGFGTQYAAEYIERVACLIVRGVSDMISDKTSAADAARQPVAASHAAAFAFEVLAYISTTDVLRLNPLSTPSLLLERKTSRSRSKGKKKTSKGQFANGPTNAVGIGGHSRCQFVLTLDGELSNFDGKRIDEILGSIREASSDQTITLLRIEKGSVRLLLEVDRSSEKRLREPEVLKRIEETQRVRIREALPADTLEALKELEEQFELASAELLHWTRDLPGGEWLERPEIEELTARLKSDEPSTTIVLGEPGAGKSALLSRLADRLLQFDDHGTAVLAIKADSLPTRVDNDRMLQQHLGISVDPAYAVEQLSRWKRVVVIVDQLDALAYHVDLNTGRLNVLLNLIRRLSGTPNVHIIASSRTFEFEHDSRLRTTGAESVYLQLPAWHVISGVLAERGLDANEWPEDARDLLRNPQALRIFLELLAHGQPGQIFSTYSGMLDRLWRERVLTGPSVSRKAALVSELASTMAEEESLWLAEARFDDRQALIHELEAAGILVRLSKGATIGFSHQTVFEHALARGFAQQPEGLSRYVVKRQDSLFVRPKLWVALRYLRDVEPQTYEREINRIWRFPALRHHLRQLLAEFLGQQDEPFDGEELLLVPVLLDRSSELRAAAVAAVSGSKGWFQRLEVAVIAQIMRDKTPPVAVVAVLAKAWSFAPNSVLTLLKNNWLGRAGRDFLSWLVLENCSHWDTDVLDVATTILQRTAIDSFRVDHLATRILSENPVAAFSLIRASLDRELTQLKNEQTQRAKPPFPADGTEDQQIAWHIQHDSEKPFRRFLERHDHYYDLSEMARSHPIEFINVLWPWYLRLLCESARGETGFGSRYRGDTLISFTDAPREHRPPLAAALLDAISALAKESPEHFLKWVSANKLIELLSVQRLIARGLIASLSSYVKEAVDFLLADRRRLMLGDYRDRFSTTKALISALVPSLPEAKVRELEAAVMAFESMPSLSKDSAVKERQNRLKRIRSDRLRLLRAFPREALSDQLKKIVPEEERALQTPPDWDSYSTGMQAVGSPMSATAMEQARDADILKILDEIPDEAEWNHPRDFMRGGNIQLSREFAQFASLSPVRAARIIRELKPGRHERAAGYAIASIAGSNINNQVAGGTEAKPELAFDLLRDLAKKGFHNTEFRESVARAISGLAGRRFPIPEDIVALLEAWLALPETHDGSGQTDRPDARIAELSKSHSKNTPQKDQVSHSILWDQRTVGLPAGNYPVLEALSLTFLTRHPPEIERWLKVLNAHLDRKEDPEVWRALLRYLQYCAGGSHDDASTFIGRLFRRYPKLLDTEDAALLIAQTQSWVGVPRLRSWIRRLKFRSNPIARQAYGELLALVYILRPSELWVAEAANDLASSNSTETLGSRVGVAFAAANLWANPEHSDSAVDLLVKLIPNADANIARAILDSFRVTDELRPDGPTTRLLQCLADHPRTIRLAESSFLAERLATLLPHEAELVGRLALMITEQWKDKLGDVSTSIAATTPELVNLALTLHRLGGSARQTGTTLFEKLLQMEACGAREALHDIDRPLRTPGRTLAQRPRMRRGRRNAR